MIVRSEIKMLKPMNRCNFDIWCINLMFSGKMFNLKICELSVIKDKHYRLNAALPVYRPMMTKSEMKVNRFGVFGIFSVWISFSITRLIITKGNEIFGEFVHSVNLKGQIMDSISNHIFSSVNPANKWDFRSVYCEYHKHNIACDLFKILESRLFNLHNIGFSCHSTLIKRTFQWILSSFSLDCFPFLAEIDENNRGYRNKIEIPLTLRIW